MRLVVAGLVAGLLAGCASGAGTKASTGSAKAPAPAAATAPERARDESAAGWFRAGAESAHAHGAGRESATNLILFLGDGMSLPTVAAARILEGQRAGRTGEENQLAFERFPYTALSKTYNVDSQTPDSAGTMSAIVTGSKTRMGVLSVAPTAIRGDCASAQGAQLASLLEIAEAAGLSTGVVTTTRITHATPGATYAHTPERNWETDSDLPEAAKAQDCRDIARQLIEFPYGDGIEVALGGGRSHFLPAGADDPEHPQAPGDRLDGRDLVQEWRQRSGGQYVWNSAQLHALDLAQTRRLLGLFEPDHMNFEHDRKRDPGGEPSLAEMTRAAISVLSQNKRGFFLMVEGGRIDHGHHAGNAYRALTDTIAFSDAVRAAAEASAGSDTLIVVTADHSHTLNFVGYPKRGNPILGKVVGGSGEDSGPGFATDGLGLPYTTLSYANGPGYAGATDEQPEGPKRFPHIVSRAQTATGRPQLAKVDTEDPDYLQEATMPGGSETHGGDDVGVWATGPGASAVHGSIEQNEIFHLLLQAQPRLRELLCGLGECESGVPVLLPSPAALRPKDAAQAR